MAVLSWFSFGGVSPAATDYSYKAEASIKETYDSNVYLQDSSPTNHVPGAVSAKKDSLVTTASPRLTFEYAPSAALKATLSYTPDYTWYHNTPSENNMTHRWGLNAAGALDTAAWDVQNAFTYIDGSKTGPTFGRPGDCPALGGIPLRDRRAAFIYRGGFKFTETLGRWMIRPVASAYDHDFLTHLRPSPAGAVYENYIDRRELSGGLDVGYDPGHDTRLLAGYRYGRQDQYQSVTTTGARTNSPYSNAYHRILAGAEGAPASWLKFSVLAGPDFRQFDHDVPGFYADRLLWYVDASVTLLPIASDTIVLSTKRFEQPAFSSFSMYQDITYEAAWKHKFNNHWSGNAGFKLYIGDWQLPVNRDDWIYTPTAGLTYTYDKHFSADFSFLYDAARNEVSTGAAGATYANGRDYTRVLVSLGARYTF